MKLDRRHFLAATGALATGTALAQATSPLPFFINTWNTPLMPPAKGRKRVVVAGGGWGGISAAKHLKQNDPNLEVVVLERNPVFFSCPMSNKWLVDIVNAEYLTQSYLKTADKFGYTFVQTEVTGFERDKKRVITAQGWIDYDYLIVAAGIRYNYETWFGNDRRAADYTKANYPAAYIPTAEHFTLKRGIQEFEGVELVMTLPQPPHR